MKPSRSQTIRLLVCSMRTMLKGRTSESVFGAT